MPSLLDSSPGNHLLDNLDNLLLSASSSPGQQQQSSNNTLLDSLLQTLELEQSSLTPPPTRPPSPLLSNGNGNHGNNFLYPKRPRLDSSSSNASNNSLLFGIINNPDVFLFDENGGKGIFGGNGGHDSESEEEEDSDESKYSLEHLRSALANDHSYCAPIVEEDEEEEEENGGRIGNKDGGVHCHGDLDDDDEAVLLDGLEVENGGGSLIDFENMPKKTKILVPLKSLMKTLQQKSFLVSPLGPGKKVIRLVGGNGEFFLLGC